MPGTSPIPQAGHAPAIETEHLSKTYLLNTGLLRAPLRLQAVSNVSVHVQQARTLGIVGESGCGKSTLSRMLSGTTRATAGRIKVAGTDITALRGSARETHLRQVQMVFQSPYNSLDPRMTIAQIVREPLDVHRKDLSHADRRAMAVAMLERVGLRSAYQTHYPHQLSGGQPLWCMDRAGQLVGVRVDGPVSHLRPRKPPCRSRPTPTAGITSRSSNTGRRTRPPTTRPCVSAAV